MVEEEEEDKSDQVEECVMRKHQKIQSPNGGRLGGHDHDAMRSRKKQERDMNLSQNLTGQNDI